MINILNKKSPANRKVIGLYRIYLQNSKDKSENKQITCPEQVQIGRNCLRFLSLFYHILIMWMLVVTFAAYNDTGVMGEIPEKEKIGSNWL